MTAKNKAYPDQAPDQRADGRISTCLNGKLFFPAEQVELDCVIKNVSAGGAGVCCDEPPPLHSFVMLDIEGFGRFACVTTRFVENELGLKFVFNEVQRHRLMRDLLADAGEKPQGREAAKRQDHKSPGKKSPGKARQGSSHGR